MIAVASTRCRTASALKRDNGAMHVTHLVFAVAVEA
jgi:hypothetical protein